MKHMESDRHTIAWFKLAECVSRGEREKALGVFRLLAHSLDDKAYASQLEGDLLWSFGDKKSVAKYTSAAQLYQDHARIKQAVAVYEHIHQIVPSNKDVTEQLVMLYSQLGDDKARRTAQAHSIVLLLDSHDTDEACNRVEQWCQGGNSDDITFLYRTLVIQLCRVCPARKDLIISNLHILLDAFLQLDSSVELQTFLSELQELNQAYFKEAERYLKS